ncbi:MAG TPA: maleylpyruvate isomerase family mycothiol-dependent enzyme [Anaerolineales bacterium]|nr:maleylpyruvate isomerase family mycothiol-dependent enzyme [Anaerolineales bacterium]
MNAAISPSTIAIAERIPYTNADEAHALMQTSFDRLIRVLERLAPDDWSKPTACTEWDVHDVVAHQAGGYLSGVGYTEMMRQYAKLPKRGQLPEDAINALQVGERKKMTPAELIDELKRTGTQAIHNWAYRFHAVKWIHAPHPIGGFMSLRYLMWVTHSRDTWMHRLDICRAANLPFEQTREHDGRIVELVVRDLAKKLNKRLDGRGIILLLTGISGGTWKIGKGEPAAEMEMDALDFNIFVSGRFSYEEGMKRARIAGDKALVENAFKDLLILY